MDYTTWNFSWHFQLGISIGKTNRFSSWNCQLKFGGGISSRVIQLDCLLDFPAGKLGRNFQLENPVRFLATISSQKIQSLEKISLDQNYLYNNSYLTLCIFSSILLNICNFHPILMNNSSFYFLEHFLQFCSLDFIQNNLFRIRQINKCCTV